MSELLVRKMQQPIEADLVAPPSKYHTHRAFILGALAEGTSTIAGVSQSLDNMSTVRCLSLLGTEFESVKGGYKVRGCSFRTPPDILNSGNSGSTIHFLMGVSSTAPGTLVFTGDSSLRSRPLDPFLKAINDWGIEAWSTQANGLLPVVVKHRDPTKLSDHVAVSGLISPWTSGLILLAPFTGHNVTVEVIDGLNEAGYTTMMIKMMSQFGVTVEPADDGQSFFIPGGQHYQPAKIEIPGDVALASFGLVLAALSNSKITYTNIDLRVFHPEAKIIEILQEMGADIRIDAEANTVEVRGGRRLRGIQVDCNDAPDIVPILSLLFSMAEGHSRITNVEQLRIKEADRLAAMCQLNKMGARVTETDDGLAFEGVEKLHGAYMESMHDHRLAMSWTIAGLLADGESQITEGEMVAVSYPDFLIDLEHLGVSIEKVD